MSKKIDIAAIAPVVGTLYPPPYDEPCLSRERRKLGDAAGLRQYGVNLLRLPPGVWSSQRHWHTKQDEFVYVLQGEVTLVTNDGAELLKAGDAAGFKAGDEDGHCLQNRSGADALVLEIGTRIPDDAAYYPEIDLVAPAGNKPTIYTHRDGTPYEGLTRRDKPVPPRP
ncbi:MAG TPA: cupin domain-containing protein [Acetobacteraceae bacterium]|nr:cupin domain-containing protein [Acetobacteraceae bacterium]